MDVYSFLSSPTSSNNSTDTISTLVNKSRADIENNGILNQEYAAQIVCILSQYVDRSVDYFNYFNFNYLILIW